jgi:hypothetical protein
MSRLTMCWHPRAGSGSAKQKFGAYSILPFVRSVPHLEPFREAPEGLFVYWWSVRGLTTQVP